MKWLMLGVLPLIIISCSSRHITTIWKADQVYNAAFKQVLVVAILPGNDSLDRKQIESALAADLKGQGYPAVAAVDYFGTNGLAGMGQESTYIKLCSSGIDYVLTIAQVDRMSDQSDHIEGSLLYTGNYYYNRIWEYKNRTITTVDNTHQYFYESILFDLAGLKAVSVLRTRSFYPYQNMQAINNLPGRLISKMLKEKILVKQPRTIQPRAF